MGNEQVKIEQEVNNNSNNDKLQNYTIDELIKKKNILNDILQNKRHILSSYQIEKINIILNTIVNQISNLIFNNSGNQNITSSTQDSFNLNENNSKTSQDINLQMAFKLFKYNPINKITEKELNIRYHKLALATHPDKFGGNSTKFNLVQTCYKILLEYIIGQNNDKPHHELKNIFQSQHNKFNNNYNEHKDDNISTTNILSDNDKFNSTLFNKYYEQNKLAEPTDIGYEKWFKSNDDVELCDLDKLQGNVSKDKFNIAFQQKKINSNSNNQLNLYKGDPLALISCNTSFSFLDNQNNIDDFSKEAEARNGLGYTDLKTAYTSRGQFIDPNSVDIKTYKNIQEYEKNRSDISFKMTSEQEIEFHKSKVMEDEIEKIRLQKIKERDAAITQHYTRIHTQMLGYKPKI